jgi:hypothetical protein
MKRLILLIVLVVIFVELPPLGLSDTVISSDDIATPSNEAAGDISKTGNSSASGTITMYTGDEE